MFDLGATGTTFGIGTASEVEELNKALTAGYGRGGDTTDGAIGSPLRVESLEATLKLLTFSEKHIVFWRDIPKLPAFNTVEEFNQMTSYGNVGGYFVPEGVTPGESDSTYVRKTVQVKYLGSLRKVSHQMSLVRPAHGDVIALETMAGTREILKAVEDSLFAGDASCVAQEWNGIERQFLDGIGTTGDEEVDANIFDMRGAALTQASLSNATKVIMDNFGFPTAMYLGFKAMNDLNNLFINKEQVWLNQPTQGGMAGFPLQGYNTMGGAFGFRPSVFLKPGEDLSATARGLPGQIPSTAGVTFAVVAASDASLNNQFGAGDAGTYHYRIALENRFGVTAPISTPTGAGATSAAVTTGQRVTLTVSALTGTTATAVRIYRGPRGVNGQFKLIKRIPFATNAARGTTATTDTLAWVDRNLDIPGTSKAFLMQVDLDVMSFKQLAPFSKIPLATIDPSIRWMQLLYGTPALYNPRRVVLLKNIG